MDVKARRKAVTYGKSNKKLPLHDIFDVSPEFPGQERACTTSSPVVAPAQLSGTLKSKEGKGQGYGNRAARQRISEESKQVSLSADDCVRTSDASSPESSTHITSQSPNPSLFEIDTSDEESRVRDGSKSAHKRRKLAPTNTTTKSNVPQVHKRFPTAQTRARSSENDQSQRQERKMLEVSQTKSQLKTFSRTKPLSRRGPMASKQILQVETSTADEDTLSSEPTTPLSLGSPISSRHRGQRSSSAEISDGSTRSPPAAATAPKLRRMLHKRIPSKAGRSPTQLGLNSLRLTPDRSIAAIETATAATEIYATQLTPRRGRQRLVDRLDSPRSISRSAETASKSGEPLQLVQLETGQIELQSSRHVYRESSSHSKGSSRMKPSENRQTSESVAHHATLTRTYAQERSHLSDMVIEDPDLAMTFTAQDPVIQAASQDNAYSSFKSQLELDDSESDDSTSGPNVRSIHELRQAGSNNRFDRELETLFEDIEPRSSSSRGLRLQALMQLITKLTDEAFTRRFIDSGMATRLAAVPDGETDVLSGVLTSFAITIVAHVDRISSTLLRQMLQAVYDLSPQLVREERNLAKVAKDRTQNLSKSLVKELSAFESTMLTGAIWHDYRPSKLTPLIVLLQSLAVITLRLQKLREARVLMPTVVFRNLLPGLSGSSSKLHGDEDSNDALLATEFAISILERCELSDNSLEEDDEDYILLGQALTRILRYAAEEKNDGLEQATLRLVVKLSNNKSTLSQALASANMLTAALVVIKTNFSNLASSADLGEDLDEQKLDSVMLALGCLLNFVDGSPGMCRKMIEPGDNSTISPVGWLVATFNERVGKASDATTINQSRVLVAFGYLSMLLCSLCLEETVRSYALSRLNGGRLDDLCVAGDTFFTLLKKIDINPDDEAMNNFTEHFGRILGAIKQYAA